MANLVFNDAPNSITQALTPGDTDWHEIAVPDTVPLPRRVNVMAAMVATGADGAAGVTLVDFNFPAGISPTVGFPILSGTTCVFSAKNTYWYKLGVSTDTLWILWSF